MIKMLLECDNCPMQIVVGSVDCAQDYGWNTHNGKHICPGCSKVSTALKTIGSLHEKAITSYPKSNDINDVRACLELHGLSTDEYSTIVRDDAAHWLAGITHYGYPVLLKYTDQWVCCTQGFRLGVLFVVGGNQSADMRNMSVDQVIKEWGCPTFQAIVVKGDKNEQ